jgi:hypothetical protein
LATLGYSFSALQEFSRSILNDSECIKAHVYKGMCLINIFNKKDDVEAINLFCRALALNIN